MRPSVAVLALGLMTAPALADEVFVRGGGRVTGQIIEQGPDSIVVDIGPGQIGLPLSYVERIVPGSTPQAVYRERAARLAPGDVAGWVALGQWAMEQDLLTKGRAAFEHVLGIDPSNAAAHQALGHVRVDDQWMTPEESYRARGFVSYQGRWITPDERRALLEERMAAAEQDRMRAEGEARIREAEARARQAEAEARLAEAELGRAATSDPGALYSTFGYSGFYPGFGYAPLGYSMHRGFSHGYRMHSRPGACTFGSCSGGFAAPLGPLPTTPLLPPRHPSGRPGR